jgi:hypothetical protein
LPPEQQVGSSNLSGRTISLPPPQLVPAVSLFQREAIQILVCQLRGTTFILSASPIFRITKFSGGTMAAKVELSLSKVILFAIFLFIALLGPQGAIAQTATGSITGTVTDLSDLPIPDAAIVVRNADTNTQTHYSTNNVGV